MREHDRSAYETYLFLIGGMIALAIAMGVGRFAYTPLLPLMQNDLAFSNRVAGYLATANYAGYLIGAVLAGVIPLKNHKTKALRISLIISILATLLMGIFQSYLFWYVLRLISGVTSAFIFVSAASIVLDKLASENKTSWSGYVYGGVGLGIFITSLIIPSLNRFYYWQGTWIGLALLSGILAIFVWIWLKDNPSNATTPKDLPPTIHITLPPKKWLPWLIIAYGLEGLGYIVTGTFIVSIAEESSIFHSDATFVWFMVGIAAIPSCIVWSSLAKKFGFVKSLVWAMLLQAFGIGLPVFWMSQISLIISALLFGATFMGIATLVTTLARQISPTNSSRIIGYATAIFAVGQMIGPSIAGIISSFTHNYNSSLLGAAIVVLLGGCLLLTGIKYEKKSYAVTNEWR